MNNESLLKTLKELRIKKKTGELDEKEEIIKNEAKWRDELDYDLLESCMDHISEDIRLEALGLVIDSKKSTLYFLQKELNLILYFLKLNLGERLEFVPIVKRALKRMKESLAVFRRNLMQLEKLELCKQQVTDKIDMFEKLKEEIIPVANESTKSIKFYERFFARVRDVCLAGICPGSTHTTKKNCLGILKCQQELLGKEFPYSKWNAEQANKLYECLLLDTYEINKESVYKILMEIDTSLLKFNDENKVTEILVVALKLANSIRPIDCITASYMLKICLLSPVIKNVLQKYAKSNNFNLDSSYSLIHQLIIIVLEELKEPAKLASENIIIASAKHSLYGYLACIKSLLQTCDLKKISGEAWRKTIDDIISICLSLNESVSQIVNNSSPEGHFPMDLESKNVCCDEENSEIVSVTPQMVLLCSWRTVKEVSLLFGYLTEKSQVDGENSVEGLLTGEQILKIGEHLVTLLCETKHRGAFEQAHVGFEQVCRRLWKLQQNNLNQLPKIWLYELLLEITGLTPGNSKLCSTRRSAGVPFMVQALLASEPSVRNKSTAIVFHTVMKILLGLMEIDNEIEIWAKSWELISTDKFFLDIQSEDAIPLVLTSPDSAINVTITEVKTHALNILRALFKHAQLGDLTKNYAADGLIASIKSFDEKTWAERNAATLLYSSLITRIFGVQRTKDHLNLTVHNKMTGRTFFEKYPKLLEFMLTELKTFIHQSDEIIKPSVQTILLLLSRLYLSLNFSPDDDNWKINKFVSLVSACAKSRVYKTRELAARALVPLLTENSVRSFLKELIEKIADEKNRAKFNLTHGYMLQIFEIAKSGLLSFSNLSMVSLDFFLNGSSWILEFLEIENNYPACFPLATAYIEALGELVKIYYRSDNQIIFDKLFQRLLNHTSAQQVLKSRPGKEIYEAAATKLFISLMELKLKEEPFSNELQEAWTSILSFSNCEVQITGWMSVVLAIHQTSSKKLFNCAIVAALENMKKSGRIDPDLQSVIYEFLYDVFIANGKNIEAFKNEDNLKSLSKSIIKIFTETLPPKCPSLFKLLGKAFGKIVNDEKEMELINNSESLIYEMFCENSWSGSADCNTRIAIATVISDMYLNIRKTKRMWSHAILLDWWTTILNLLVDDSNEVRRLAAIAVSQICPISTVKCNCSSVKLFFNKFSKCFYDEVPTAFAAYFAWTMSLSGDDYEMDESDVFNKSFNYEAFEPLRISDLCGENLNLLHDRLDIETAFPVDVQKWLSRRLNIALGECKDARSLITFYRRRLPSQNKKLNDILDPTYNDKLLQYLAFEKFAAFENDKSWKISWANTES